MKWVIRNMFNLKNKYDKEYNTCPYCKNIIFNKNNVCDCNEYKRI